MSKIFLTEGIERWAPQILPDRPVCIVHPKYSCPKALTKYRVDYRRFVDDARSVIGAADVVYLVGLSQMITPGNRTKMVWEVVFNTTPEIPKVVVDNVLFRVSPWRIVFMFNAVGERYLEYTYSYIAESHYNSYCDGHSDYNPFAGDTVISQGASIIQSNYKSYFVDMDITRVALCDNVHAEYQKLKTRCFEEETTINRIIKRLTGFAQERCPERHMPDLNRLWDNRTHNIVTTDLGVDIWLVSQIEHAARLTNDLLEGFHVD